MFHVPSGLITPDAYTELPGGTDEATKAAKALTSQARDVCLALSYATDGALQDEELSEDNAIILLSFANRLLCDCTKSLDEVLRLLD